MRLLRLFHAILLVAIYGTTIDAQEQLGLRLENFSGLHSATLNPALPATSPFRWDANLISIAGFFDNNYGFFKDASAFDVRRIEDIQTQTDLSENGNLNNNALVLDYVNDRSKRWASGSFSIMGPSLMINLDSGWSFGLFTQFRTVGSIRNVPNNLSYYPYDSTPRFAPIEAAPFNGTTMAWGELGFNVSRKIDTWYGAIALGGNMKMLGGFEAAYGTIESDFQLTKNGGDTLDLQRIDAAFGFTTTNADIYNSKTIAPAINGYGLGLDLGVQFVIEGSRDVYQWKFGASILDLGSINFTKNTESHQVNSEESFKLIFSDYEDLTNPKDVAQVLSYKSMGDSLLSFQQNNFNVWLPTAFSLQADYAITNNVFLNATFIQRMPIGKQAVNRDNVLALSPRFEHRWFGMMMPISVLNYQQVHLGLAARLGFLTIGTDNLGSFRKQKELTGSDFYLALKLNPFNRTGSSSGKSKRGGNVKCYSF